MELLLQYGVFFPCLLQVEMQLLSFMLQSFGRKKLGEQVTPSFILVMGH
jgi:hypothetical protein